MEDCKSCRVPLGFLSFSDPLPQSPHASYSIDSSEDEPEPIPIDSALVQAAFRRGLGNSGLALETADFKQDGVSQVEIVHTGSRYGIPQPNCLAVGITNGIRGAVIGSVFGGAMALSTAVQSGYRGTSAATYAGAGAARNAAAFASWTALYGTSRCSLVRMRGRRDLLNPTLAGGFTGGVLTLISVRGQWRFNQNAILANAAGSAMVAVMFEALSYM